MKIGRIIVVASCLVGDTVLAANDPARFWITNKSDNPNAPSTISAPVNRPVTLYIWAAPGSNSNGDPCPIMDFSLDVVTQNESFQPEPLPFVDFINGSYTVYNPTVGVQQRFQKTVDSHTPEADGGALLSNPATTGPDSPDYIQGLQGLSPTSTATVVGIGSTNEAAPYRYGSAWRVAEISFMTLAPPNPETSTSNMLFLQLGYTGMVSQGAEPINVRFGDNSDPVYQANCTSDDDCDSWRQVTLVGDTFDIKINAVTFQPGDYDSDGSIGPGDYTYWRNSFGQIVPVGTGADGSGNGTIDAADYVFWRKRMAAGSASFYSGTVAALDQKMSVVPEPASNMIVALLLLIAVTMLPRTILPNPARNKSSRHRWPSHLSITRCSSSG